MAGGVTNDFTTHAHKLKFVAVVVAAAAVVFYFSPDMDRAATSPLRSTFTTAGLGVHVTAGRSEDQTHNHVCGSVCKRRVDPSCYRVCEY